MNTELPLYRQLKDETCALACLRMVLAARGVDVEESTIEAETRLAEGGTPIEELERLARHFGLRAHIQHASADQLRNSLGDGNLCIVYLNRTVFQLSSLRRLRRAFVEAKLHAVIPTHITERFVTFHDPLPPRISRRSLRRFDRARWFLRHATLVCGMLEKP